MRGHDPDTVRLERGISVYATMEQARRTMLRFPALGKFIAELEIQPGGPIAFERTLTAPGHHTLWGEPHDMLESVTRTFEAT